MSITVSIAIPLYLPDANFLGAALGSIRSQTSQPTEIVLVDDSPLSNADLVHGLSVGLPVTYMHRGARLGLVGNWNEAVRATSGSHVLQLHQDDELEPAALEVMSGVMERNPGVAICSVGEIRVDSLSQQIQKRTRVNHREHVFVRRDEYHLAYSDLAYLMLRNGQVFGTPSAMLFSREHFDRINGFDDAFAHSVDIDFALRMAREGGAHYVRRPLVRVRMHASQTTQTNIANGNALRDRRLLFERHSRAIPDDRLRAVKANLVVRAGFDGIRALRYGRWGVATQAFAQAGHFWPGLTSVGSRVVEVARRKNLDTR